MDERSRESASPEPSDAAASVATLNARSLFRSQTKRSDQLIRYRHSPPPKPACIEDESRPSRPVGLDFPTLGSDGSVESLTSHSTRVYERTPPAALSTLGVKARMNSQTNLSESMSSLADSHYDMIDDLSEISNDDHETASLASNDRDTTFDEDADVDVEARDDDLVIPSPNGDNEINPTIADYFINLPSKSTVEAGRSSDVQRKHEMKMENALIDSYMSDDLETPRQSTLSHNLVKTIHGKLPAEAQSKDKLIDEKPTAYTWLRIIFESSACVAALAILVPYVLVSVLGLSSNTSPIDILGRRESLLAALTDTIQVPSPARSFDVEHLLPQISTDCISTDIFGRYTIKPTCEQNTRYLAVAPNHMVVALPMNGRFPQVISADVVKSDGRKVEFNRTELIEGVHVVTFDLQEAYGAITATLLVKKPGMEVKATHNYGSRMLQRKTYENAGTDVSNAVGKEVSVMKHAAKNLTDKMSTELKSSYQATKNMTTELALSMSRDIQIFTNSALSVFGKAASVSNNTVTALSRIETDLIKFTKNISTSLTTTIEQVKRETKIALRNPLERSRNSLVDIGQAVGCMARMNKSGCKTRGTRQRQQALTTPNQEGRKTSSVSTPSDQDAASQPSSQAQRKINRALQQFERVSYQIKLKEQEYRASGDRAIRKDIRGLKKEQKKRENALKEAVGTQNRR